MATCRTIFERSEKKYLLSRACYQQLMEQIGGKLQEDEFAVSSISSPYFDTPDFAMINRSLEKPMFKEKIRIRAYGEVDADGIVFVELKKKFDGIVYKRRFPLACEEAYDYLEGMPYEEAAKRSLAKGLELPEAFSWQTLQTVREVDACIRRNPGLAERIMVHVDRLALRSNDGSDVRVTFDFDARWRSNNLNLGHTSFIGRPLFSDGSVIMELKSAGAYPMWLVDALNHLSIHPQSCSKVGRAYQAAMSSNLLVRTPKHAKKEAKSA